MRSLYIASTEGSGGKTTLSVGLCPVCGADLNADPQHSHGGEER